MKNKNELDDLLRKWSAARRKSDVELRPLARRITGEALRRRNRPDAAPQAEDNRRKRLPALAAGWVAGLTVAALIAAAVLLHNGPPPVADRGNDDPAEIAAAGISREELAELRRLFDEMEYLFDDQFRWLAEHNGKVNLSVDSLRGGPAAGSKPVFYRLTVVAGSERTGEWETVWNADILLRSEEQVNIRTGRCGLEELVLWVYPLPDGAVAVDADLKLDKPGGAVSKSAVLQRAGVPLEILSVRDGETEYRVLQTVSTLEDMS